MQQAYEWVHAAAAHTEPEVAANYAQAFPSLGIAVPEARTKGN